MGKKAQNGISMYSLNFNKNVGDKPFSLGIHADGKVTYWGYNSKVVKVSKLKKKHTYHYIKTAVDSLCSTAVFPVLCSFQKLFFFIMFSDNM